MVCTRPSKACAGMALILKSCVAGGTLAQALEASQHPQILVEASLRKFLGGTLWQYLRAIRLFLTFVNQCVGDAMSLTLAHLLERQEPPWNLRRPNPKKNHQMSRHKSRAPGSSKERRLIVPYSFSDFDHKTAKFFNPLNVFPMSPVNVTTPFLVRKALKTANSEKCVFLCPASKVQPGPPNSLVFRRSRCLQCSEIRILPRKTCEFQPAELVTAEVTGL